ncbi:hypothetical protein F4778DRAFT_762544 [Xylariomycetidae sp. FL2044]|nr:hypothetical protein F4778DRAFT_762544 [Xylariomycetidae sp. FL2044]
MGQRHQLFVIARIGNRYRSLAAIHRQWLYNKGAYAVCTRLSEIFQETANHPLLHHEMTLAAALTEADWNAEASPSSFATPKFPFIASCLLLGTSFDPDKGVATQAHLLPFNTPYDGGDNNDGVTILDITNPAKVRHAFVFPGTAFEHISRLPELCNIPLTGDEYCELYSEENSEEISEDGRATNSVEQTLVRLQALASPETAAELLIDEDTLRSAWPRSSDQRPWGSRVSLGLPAASPAAGRVDQTHASVVSAHEPLHDAFINSWKSFENYSPTEYPMTGPGALIKQIVHIVARDDGDPYAPLSERRPILSPQDELANIDKCLVWTLPLEDAALTRHEALEGLQRWIWSCTLPWWTNRNFDRWFDMGSSFPTAPQALAMSFGGFTGPNRRTVKPLPGKAMRLAKDACKTSIHRVPAYMQDINQGEWTMFLIQKWNLDFKNLASTGITSFKVAFVSRDSQGDIISKDASAFRSDLPSPPEDEAAQAGGNASKGEKSGQELIDGLARGTWQDKTLTHLDGEELKDVLKLMDVVREKEKEWWEGYPGEMLRMWEEQCGSG